MAEPSLLCVNCARPPPPHRRTWSRCTVCVERNLPSTYYCGEECMNAHWPKHQQYHTAQKQRAKQMREMGLEQDRSLAEQVARRAERTGSDVDQCDRSLAEAAQPRPDRLSSHQFAQRRGQCDYGISASVRSRL